MKHRNVAFIVLLLASFLFLWNQPLTAAGTDKTVLLKLHVPFAGG